MNTSELEFKESDLIKNRNRQFASGIIIFIVNLYTIYIIIFKSPKRIGKYRWFQLDMVVSAFILFFYITCFWTPFLLFPTLGCCTTGILSYFKYVWVSNVATLVAIELLSYALVSALINSFYRLFALYNKEYLFLTPLGLSIQFILKTGTLLPIIISALPIVFYSNENQDSISKEVYKFYPQLVEFIQTDNVCVLLPLGYVTIKHIFLAFIGIILLNTFVSFLILYVSIHFLNKQRNVISKETYSLQKQFLITLFLQLFLPLVVVILPGSFIIYFTLFETTFGTEFTSIAMLIVSTYPNWNCMAVLLSSKTNRQRLYATLRLQRFSTVWTTTSNVQNTSTMKTGPSTGAVTKSAPTAAAAAAHSASVAPTTNNLTSPEHEMKTNSSTDETNDNKEKNQ